MKAELLDIFGDDRMIVNVARTSYDKWKSEQEELGENDTRLIRFLVYNEHTSPLRHPQIQFRIECPIFVERQLFKHQIGATANSVSGRYVDFSESFYEITELREQSKSSKQGSDAIMNRPDLVAEMNYFMDKASRLYGKLSKEGVAKELSRAILPLSLNTKFIWTGSLWFYIHLFNLRLKPDAQKETRLIVQQMKDAIISSGKFKFAMASADKYFSELSELKEIARSGFTESDYFKEAYKLYIDSRTK